MSAECKTVTCCDLDDFPQTSSSDGNCPVGWTWDGTTCVRCSIPAAPTLEIGSNIIVVYYTLEAGQLFTIDRFSDGHWMVLLSSMGVGGLELYDDLSVVPGETYQYRISVAVSEECGYIEGESASGLAI